MRKPKAPPDADVAMVGHEPCVTVPLSHLRGNGNCATCKLFHTDRAAFVEIGNMLMSGSTYADVSKRARELGYPISEAMLARHRVRHMDAALCDLFQETQAAHVIAQECLDIHTGDLAQAEVKVVSGIILRALRKIKPKKLEEMAESDPVGLIELAAKHAGVMSRVQASARQAELNEEKLKFERAKAVEGVAAQLKRCFDTMRRELEQTPGGKEAIEHLIALANAPAP